MIQSVSAGTPLYRRRRGISVTSSGAASGYSAAVLTDSPALYWQLAEPSGTTAADASGNGRTGTYAGGVILNQPSLLSGDAAGRSVDVNGGTVTSTFDPLAATNICTIEAVVTRDSVGTTRILYSHGGAINATLYDLGSTGGDGARLYINGSNDWAGALSGVAQGGTCHLAVILNNAAHTVELFVNGVSKGVVSGIQTANAGANLTLGGGWTGNADEFVAYTSALSAVRIAAHAAAR